MNWRLLFTVALCCVSTAGAQEGESILSYESDITVRPDASLLVRETIVVRALGQKIHHGIYRDFPTNYKTPWFTRFTTTFEVQEVLRDGKPEPYWDEAKDNGIRLYIGDKDSFVTPGEYTYTITYVTRNQMAHWDDEDELYWNVTGNGWEFPIESATARVRLPRVVNPGQLKVNAFTGPDGATEKNYRATVEVLGDIVFTTTRPLNSLEGLTISVAYPRGIVARPTPSEILRKWATDNPALRAVLFGVCVTFAYFVFAWFLVGRDPAPGRFQAVSQPPKNISPASARFITRMGFDNQTFATALVSLAVKKCVQISESNDVFTVKRLEEPLDACAPEEKALLKALLPSGNSIAFRQSNHKRVTSAIKACHDTLKSNYEKRFFVTNYGYFLPGVLLALTTIVMALVLAPHGADGSLLFFAVWLSIWSIGCFALGHMVISSWRMAFKGVGHFMSAVFSTAFATPFFAAEIFVIGLMFGSSGIWVIPVILLLVAMNWTFYRLIKRPTLLGRRVLDEIDGFRAYLEGGRQTLPMTAPDPAQFNEYIAYAIALGVDDEWANRFAQSIGDSQGDDTADDTYRPYWYNGDRWRRRGMTGFSSAVASSMTGAIAAASVAPGSSSSSSGRSSSGGGSSGGGGGGGGGGGW